MNETNLNLTCRLCLNNNFLHSNIFIGQSADNLPIYEIINYVYDLQITVDDGLPECICENCLSAVMTFNVYKTNAHKARVEFLRLKQKINNVNLKEDDYHERSASNEDFTCIEQGKRSDLQDFETSSQNEVKKVNPADVVSLVKVEEEEVHEPPVALDASALPPTDATKSHQCEYCKRCFQKKSHLKGHLVTHTGEKAFECSVCKKRFSIKGNLLMHLRIHSGNKPFGCDVCWKRFSQKSTLQSHLITHTSARPYSCNICQKTFTFNSSLRKHLKRHAKD